MSKVKAVASTIKLVINAGQAKPSPPVGPALGQAGLKIMDFCKDFNGKTADIKVSDTLVFICSTWGMLYLGESCGVSGGNKITTTNATERSPPAASAAPPKLFCSPTSPSL